MEQPALSSSYVTYAWTYHVFLSFQGVDTRFGFTNNLYQALVRKGIRSFIDHEELQEGEEISPSLVKAIKESRITIVIFSKDYASSTYCLEELVTILNCIKRNGRLVWPIFYDVDPYNVRYQLKSYKEAFEKHEKRFGNNSDKVQKWKAAISEAANLKGEYFNRNEYEYEYDFIKRIIQQISRIINLQPLHIIANHLVGLESRVQKVITLLDGGSSEAKCMVGICGIGKSTIARAVFNLIADQFEDLCFLPDVRENSVGNQRLVELQQTLLFKILGEKKTEFMDVNEGCGIIKDRLQQKKVLLILDDVDHVNQLQILAGGLDWFGSVSKIIITTRDKHLLHVHDVKRIYEVEGLDDEEAQKLFTWNAFRTNEVGPSHVDISKRVVSYCQGVPLALDIIGCNLFGKHYEECKSALDTYEKILDKDIQKILKVSYDGLNELEKVIFLDVACFFKGCKLEYILNILVNGRGFDAKYGIGVLVEKSLININPVQNSVSMHDLIQQMGTEIVRQKSPLKCGERSRLWFYEDILLVLEENMGTDIIEFIMLDLPEDEEVVWDGEAFKDMRNLKILIIKNAHFSQGPKHLPNSLRILNWTGYPSSSLPQDFHPRKLVILNLTNGLFDFGKPLQKFKFLTHMELGKNKSLNQIPDISALQNLKRLNVSQCTNLIEIHHSVGHLNRLEELYATGCSKLMNFPCVMESTYLRCLNLSGCIKLQSFPEISGNYIGLLVFSFPHEFGRLALEMEGPINFALFSSSISMLPKFDKLMVPAFSKLSTLMINGCNLTDEVLVSRLSCSFSNLKCLALRDNTSLYKFLCSQQPYFNNLEILDLSSNNLTDNHFSWIPWFPNLVELVLAASNFTILPACIKQCHHLRKLVLDNCHQLQTIIEIPSIEYLSAISCTCLTSQSSSLLMSQKLHEDGNSYFILPGSKIPEWFDHRCQGSSLCFWFRKNFPSIALCLVHFRPTNRITIQVRVNKHEMDFQHHGGYFISRIREVEHVSLFDLDRTIQTSGSDVEEEEYIKDGWNHVEVECIGYDIKWIGVHLYKQKTNRENIIFGYTPTGSKKRKRVHQ